MDSPPHDLLGNIEDIVFVPDAGSGHRLARSEWDEGSEQRPGQIPEEYR